MLNRRILRIKAFKVLYSYAENPDLTLKEALQNLDTSAEATRDLYLYLLALIPALTAEAARRTEAARGKFNPTRRNCIPISSSLTTAYRPSWREIRISSGSWKRRNSPGSRTTLLCMRSMKL